MYEISSKLYVINLCSLISSQSLQTFQLSPGLEFRCKCLLFYYQVIIEFILGNFRVNRTTWSLLLENSSGYNVADSITDLLSCQGNQGTLAPNRSYKWLILYLLPKTLQRIQLNKTGISKSKQHREKILKFQHGFTINSFNTQYSTQEKPIDSKLFWPKSTILKSKSAKYWNLQKSVTEIFKVYRLSS